MAGAGAGPEPEPPKFWSGAGAGAAQKSGGSATLLLGPKNNQNTIKVKITYGSRKNDKFYRREGVGAGAGQKIWLRLHPKLWLRQPCAPFTNLLYGYKEINQSIKRF